MRERHCENCHRIWMTTAESPCNCPPEAPCLSRDVFGRHADSELDVDEVVARSCPHGAEYAQLCKGCGHQVGMWGIGSAGFLDLCGCVVEVAS